jgi:hypothetical protein
MGACEATPATHSHNRGKDRAKRPPPTQDNPAERLRFLAPDRRPPLGGVKLVRPRPRLSARRCGRSSLTPARTTAQTGSDEETRQQQSHQPGGQRTKATRPIKHGLLTAGVPMGALMLCEAGLRGGEGVSAAEGTS